MNELSQHLSPDAVAHITKWLSEPKYAEYKTQLMRMIEQQQWSELEDSFFKIIEFGTGGRRGKTGIGSNRINKVTIGESAQALCQYALASDAMAAKKGVVIACDTRLTSDELSNYVASVCAANGFTTFLFDSFRSTPELSFAVRHLEAAVGIVISASHNPPEDNGFKAYWSDGGQLVAPRDSGVMNYVAGIIDINKTDFNKAVANGVIRYIGKEVDQSYLEAAGNEAEGTVRDLSIVYSPLHGAGQTNVLPLLRHVGFRNISLVEKQMIPDGNFPTVEGYKANPEERIANNEAVKQLLAEKADIAITNDPDADRIGVMVRQDNEAIYLNGNESAVLATDYSLKKRLEKGQLTQKHYIAKTIVTTDMLSALADSYGVTIYTNMLIGFKYIGELIRLKENTDEKFIIGGEESYGLLKGTYARDKDGATGALPLAEYAAELKQQGKTLYDRLVELYNEHGVYRERLDSTYFQGATGFMTMQKVMQDVRSLPPRSIYGQKVTAVRDYQTLSRLDLETSETSEIECVKGNVVVLECNGDYRCRVTIRPSGTEPKLKLYVQWYEEASNDMLTQLKELDVFLEQLSQELQQQFLR